MSESPKPVLGLVGGIGSGKSAVAAELTRHGGCLINADLLGHEALRQADIKKQVVAHFGQDILDKRVAIDRKKLGAKVFTDVSELRVLEAIVFPFIGQRIRAEIDKARRRAEIHFIVLDAAIMLESSWSGVCDKLIFVDAPFEIRRARVQQQRGWSEAELRARENLQWPLDEKKRRADAVLDNSTTQATLADQVSRLLRSWSLLA